MLDILLDDPPVLAVNKPAGLLTLGAIPGVPTLERQVKQYLRERLNKPGNVYLGIPHRLDRPVSGVIIFSRNSKGAARLAEQFRERQVRKVYWALVEGTPDPVEGALVDWLAKREDAAHTDIVAASHPGAREARLNYRTLACDGARTLLEIVPETGRSHQIRVQLASRGWPIIGDRQYGATTDLAEPPAADPKDAPIALHARALTFLHPVRYQPLTITAELPPTWNRFPTCHAPSSVPSAD